MLFPPHHVSVVQNVHSVGHFLDSLSLHHLFTQVQESIEAKDINLLTYQAYIHAMLKDVRTTA